MGGKGRDRPAQGRRGGRGRQPLERPQQGQEQEDEPRRPLPRGQDQGEGQGRRLPNLPTSEAVMMMNTTHYYSKVQNQHAILLPQSETDPWCGLTPRNCVYLLLSTK